MIQLIYSGPVCGLNKSSFTITGRGSELQFINKNFAITGPIKVIMSDLNISGGPLILSYVINSTFINLKLMHIVSDKAVFLSSSDWITLDTCKFKFNTAANGYDNDPGGGAVAIITNNEFITIFDCYIANNGFNPSTSSGNSAPYAGGIMIDVDNNVTITNCIIDGNQAHKGDGVFVNTLTTVHIVHTDFVSAFLDDVSNGLAAGVLLYSGIDYILLERCVFTYNTAWFGGGGVYVSEDSRGILILNSVFIGNIGLNFNGGGISIDESCSDVVIDSCDIHGNSAQFGGGISVGSNSYGITIYNSPLFGAACYFFELNTDIMMNKCTISNNTAISDSGGIVVATHNYRCHLEHSVISNNIASNFGDDVFIVQYNDDIIINHRNINNNIAFYGGGLHIDMYNNNNKILNSNISYNIAGGHQVLGDGEAYTKGSGDSGGLYMSISNHNMTIGHCIISFNTAAGNGGGMSFILDNKYVVITHCDILNNYASISGGGLSLEYTFTAVVKHCKVSYNTAGAV
eukprot:gene10018-20854_t